MGDLDHWSGTILAAAPAAPTAAKDSCASLDMTIVPDCAVLLSQQLVEMLPPGLARLC